MFNRLKISRIVCNIVFILLLSLITYGQKMGIGSNETCDLNQVTLGRLLALKNETTEKYPEKDYNMPLIIIANLGTNETNQKYNLQRLKETKNFLIRGAFWQEELIIIAQGEKIKGQGRIDLYFDGELQYTIKLKRNEYLYLRRGGFCYS